MITKLIRFSFSADGTCWRMTHLARKTDTPGRFTFHSQGEQSTRKHKHTKGHKRTDSTAWPVHFCFPQFGTMTTTCALLMLCMMTTPWSTLSRQRRVCLRSSTSFTVSHSSVMPQQPVHCVLKWWIQDLVKVKATHSAFAGRTPQASATLQEKFTQFSIQTGIDAENAVILPKNGMSLSHINCFWNRFRALLTGLPMCVVAAECPENWRVPRHPSSLAPWSPRLSSQ